MIKLNIDEITKEQLLQDNEFIINVKNLEFFIRVFIKAENNKLVVFSNGAVDRTKKNPPIYQRSTWHRNIDASCIFIDDKTIHNKDLNTGWGFGTKDRFFLRDYSKIVKKISKELSVLNKDVSYYGSSAGGFMSLILATFHHNSRAIVNNPQINLNKHFNPKSVNKLFQAVLPGVERQDILKYFPERIYVTENIINENYIPNILYIQNQQSIPDMNIHYNPFFDELKKEGLDLSSIQSFLYNNKKLGHNPLNQQTTEYFINNSINGNLKF